MYYDDVLFNTISSLDLILVFIFVSLSLELITVSSFDLLFIVASKNRSRTMFLDKKIY